MTIAKAVKNSGVVLAIAVSTILLNGCGGVSEAQMKELTDLRAEVSSLQTQSTSLKDERTRLEQQIAEANAKLQQCEKDREETKANLDKLPK